jgi:hypothetical protein
MEVKGEVVFDGGGSDSGFIRLRSAGKQREAGKEHVIGFNWEIQRL